MNEVNLCKEFINCNGKAGMNLLLVVKKMDVVVMYEKKFQYLRVVKKIK